MMMIIESPYHLILRALQGLSCDARGRQQNISKGGERRNDWGQVSGST